MLVEVVGGGHQFGRGMKDFSLARMRFWTSPSVVTRMSRMQKPDRARNSIWRMRGAIAPRCDDDAGEVRQARQQVGRAGDQLLGLGDLQGAFDFIDPGAVWGSTVSRLSTKRR